MQEIVVHRAGGGQATDHVSELALRADMILKSSSY